MARLLSEVIIKHLTKSPEPMAALRSVFQQGVMYSMRTSGESGDSDVHEELQPSNTSSSVYSLRIGGDSDTHEDFQATNKLKTSSVSIEDSVQQDVKENLVMIYMKGIPDAPRCGFSALAVKVLQHYGVPIGARDVLADLKLKEAVKKYTNWPTFPQIFIKGEFVGGSDIVLSMHQKGELKEFLKGITHEVDRKGT